MTKKRAKRRRVTARSPQPRASAPIVSSAIPSDQWRLPAGYHRERKGFATLRHIVDPATPTIDGPDLSDEQRVELTLERIKRQKHFRLGVLGDGLVDKQRALDEVEKRTAIGRALIDVEHRAIRLMRDYLAQHPEAAAAGPTRLPRSAPPSRGGKARARQAKRHSKAGRKRLAARATGSRARTGSHAIRTTATTRARPSARKKQKTGRTSRKKRR